MNELYEGKSIERPFYLLNLLVIWLLKQSNISSHILWEEIIVTMIEQISKGMIEFSISPMIEQLSNSPHDWTIKYFFDWLRFYNGL